MYALGGLPLQNICTPSTQCTKRSNWVVVGLLHVHTLTFSTPSLFVCLVWSSWIYKFQQFVHGVQSVFEGGPLYHTSSSILYMVYKLYVWEWSVCLIVREHFVHVYKLSNWWCWVVVPLSGLIKTFSTCVLGVSLWWQPCWGRMKQLVHVE